MTEKYWKIVCRVFFLVVFLYLVHVVLCRIDGLEKEVELLKLESESNSATIELLLLKEQMLQIPPKLPTPDPPSEI